MKFKGYTHVFAVKQSWIDNHSLKYDKEISQLRKEAEAIQERINFLEQKRTSPPTCYSCGVQFQPKMLCHSKPIGPDKRQIRCVSCAIRYGLITLDEYHLLVLGLEKHNRLSPEVLEIARIN